jgi:hypothetical protein
MEVLEEMVARMEVAMFRPGSQASAAPEKTAKPAKMQTLEAVAAAAVVVERVVTAVC